MLPLTCNIRLPGSDFEMPLSRLEGVAVDSSGNVYCGTQAYGRVQKYDPDGRFLWSLRIDAGGGVFRIRVNQYDELEVVTARTGLFYLCSSEMQLIEKYDIDVHEVFEDFGAEGEKQCRGPDGSIYRVGPSWLFPSIVRIAPSGEETTVISVPLHKWFFMAPCPAWLFALGGAFISCCLNLLKKWAQKFQVSGSVDGDAYYDR